MRPFSLYLDKVKQTLGAVYACDLAGSTPPVPQGLPSSLKFDAAESRKSEAAARVLDQLSRLAGVPRDHLLLTVGSSSAFLHALSVVTKAGDTIVVESPTYEPFVQTAKYLGLKVKRVARTGDFERDLSNYKKAKGRVLVISNPNSPTGWLYSRAELGKIAKLYDTVIVDEIFLPVFAGEVSRTQSLKNVIGLSGLSKTLGLSSLRVGWIQAAPKILRAADQIGLNSYCDVPTLPLVAAAEILPKWNEIIESHRVRVDASRETVVGFGMKNEGALSHDFLQGHFGTLNIPRKFKTAAKFADELAKKHSIKVAAGEPFDAPKAVRVSLWAEPQKVAKAFEKISEYY